MPPGIMYTNMCCEDFSEVTVSCLCVLWVYMLFWLVCKCLPSTLPGFDVNFMDDVGQTLLNWAAAFGSFEMVSHYIEQCLMYVAYYSA